MHVGKLLDADDIYVISATIKSSKITVDAQGKGGTSVEVQIPEIQQVVGGNIKLESSGQATSKLTYAGAVPLVFGFQAVRLFYDQGRYTAFEPLPSGVGAGRDISAAPLPAGVQPFTTDGPFARLGDA